MKWNESPNTITLMHYFNSKRNSLWNRLDNETGDLSSNGRFRKQNENMRYLIHDTISTAAGATVVFPKETFSTNE